MALQDRVIACGVRLTLYGMVLRFVWGPLTTMVGSLALGLRSNVLDIAIIQVLIEMLYYMLMLVYTPASIVGVNEFT